MTEEERLEIINSVLSSLRTNSRTIDQLTPVSEVADNDYIELSGGRKISFADIAERLHGLDDDQLNALNMELRSLVNLKLSIADLANGTGNSETTAMSQKAVSQQISTLLALIGTKMDADAVMDGSHIEAMAIGVDHLDEDLYEAYQDRNNKVTEVVVTRDSLGSPTIGVGINNTLSPLPLGNASQSQGGFMSKQDKQTLDTLASSTIYLTEAEWEAMADEDKDPNKNYYIYEE